MKRILFLLLLISTTSFIYSQSDDDLFGAGMDDESTSDFFGYGFVELIWIDTADIVGFEDSGHDPNSFLFIENAGKTRSGQC